MLVPAKPLSDFGARRDRPGFPRRGPRGQTKPPRPSSARWGGFINLGKRLRLQAMEGYRGAVVELRPGMYLVTEVPAEATKGFGSALLATAILKTAAKAIQDPEGTVDTAKAVVNQGKSLWHKVKQSPAPAQEPPIQATIVDPDLTEEDEEVMAYAGLLPAPSLFGRWADSRVIAGLLGSGR